MGCIFGIIGYDGKQDSRNIIKKMSSTMSFRFSQPVEVYESGNVILAAGGECGGKNQYLVSSRSKMVTAACEGEIYNIEELRNLIGSEYSQISKTGFDIIPYLYEKFGTDFPKYINGLFTVALWDADTKTLYLVRDHLGSHSLFYAARKSTVVFATTTKAIFASELVPKELDSFSPSLYFSAKAISPPDTMFKGIGAIRPAHVNVFSTGREKSHEYDYWQIHNIDVDHQITEDDFVRQMRDLIQDSVKIRSTPGSRSGAIISGGLDTSIVAATLASNSGDNPIPGFSVAFKEEVFSDADLQAILVDRFKIDHHQIILTPEVFADTLSSAAGFLDSPVNDNAYVGMYHAFKLAKESGCDCVFEGEGPDEIFPAGNTHGERQMMEFDFIPEITRRIVLRPLFSTMPIGTSLKDKVIRFAARLGMEKHERMATWRTYFHNRLLNRLLAPDFHSDQDAYQVAKGYLSLCKNKDHLNKYQYGLIKTFLSDDLLVKDERMASCQGLVNRVPLVDFRLVELALKIPSKYQISAPSPDSDGIKLLYKKALKGRIPDEILRRKKTRGFSQPTPVWYRGPLKDFVRDILLGKITRDRGIFNMAYIENICRMHIEDGANMDYAISSLLIFELWMRQHMDGRH